MTETTSTGAPWRVPSSFPELPRGGLHVWRVDLQIPVADDDVSAALSPEERARVDRLRTSAAKRRFARSRVALRCILGGYLGVQPDEHTFDYGPAGKPSLEGPVSFNVSHSDDLALCAFVRGGEVGVDVEAIRDLRDMERLAQRHFSAGEFDAWSEAGSDAVVAFFQVWTRKEALLKAAGLGLSRPLDRVDTQQGVLDDERYWLADLDPGPGYTGAVAAPHAPETVDRWLWNGR